MIVDKIVKGYVLVVKPQGELDHHAATTFRAEVDQELNRGIIRHLVLDLSALTFMDSSGLGVILGRYRQLAQWRGKMVAFGLQPGVQKVFVLSGLPKLIPVCNDLASCLGELEG